MIWDRTNRPLWLRCTVAVFITIFAAAIRWQFLGVLEVRAVFLTFYPAVAVAALYGGFSAGLLATVISAALADYFWMEPVGQFAITNVADLISLSVFLASGTLISCMAEATYLAQARANKAEQQSRLLAERESAEEKLREQREQLKVTLASIGDGVLSTDTEGKVTFINPVAAALTGKTIEEAVGQPVQSIFRIINEKTRAAADNIVERVLREGYIVALANHTALVTPDGREIPIEDSAAPIRDSKGNVSGVVLVFHDVTEKRRAQEVVRESEERFRVMANSIPQLAWIAKADGYIYWYNQRWYEYTGATPEQMEGWGWQSVHAPDVLPGVLERWKESIATGRSFDMVFPLRGMDGNFRQFLSRVEPVKNADGEVIQWCGTNTDITERRRMELEKEITTELLHLVNNNTGTSDLVKAAATFFQKQSGCEAVGIRLREGEDFPYFEARGFPEEFILLENSLCARDKDGNILRDITGDPRIECMCGNVILERVDHSKPFFSPGGSFWANSTTRLLATTSDADRQTRTRNRCNGEGYESVALIPLHIGNERLGLIQLNDKRQNMFSPEVITLWERLAGHLAVALSRSRTTEALLENQSKLNLALKASQMGVWHLDIAQNKRVFDDQVCHMLGIEPAKFTGAAEEFFDAVHPDDCGRVRDVLARTIECNAPYETDYRTVWPDGSIHHITARGSLLCDDTGQPIKLNGLIWDITERKQMEDELRKSRDELELRVEERTAELKTFMAKLEQSNQALQDFASIASHDLQEPLRKVISFGNMLRQKYADSLGETGGDYLNRMLNATERMQSLLKGLLEYSRVTSNAEPFTEIDLYDIVHEVVSDLEVMVKRVGGQIRIGELPAIEADPTQMRQLFQNLISNALKFHKEDEKPVVEVRSAVADRKLQIVVQDNGIGFEEQYLDRIFAPFQRLHGRSSQYEGTGMGLAICKKIVERHGWSITAKSSVGAGSVFVINLPPKKQGGMK